MRRWRLIGAELREQQEPQVMYQKNEKAAKPETSMETVKVGRVGGSMWEAAAG